MSKIEEALAKAARLRESTVKDKVIKSDGVRRVEAVKSGNQYIVTAIEPDSPVAEEYRRLKSMLLRETKKDFLNTIMVTSSVGGEGKSLTSINLAVALAQELDHSILLVDADLRKPMIHEYLGLEYKRGLSDYLIGEMDISEVMIKTGIGNLVVIPAGRMVENPVELLSSGKMKALVKELKQRYMDRYVIIDTPPILSCSEGIAIGSYVDGVVFVVQEKKAQKKTVEDALNMIKGLNVLGLVFNNVSEVNLDGHYSHYYYKYKKEEVKE